MISRYQNLQVKSLLQPLNIERLQQSKACAQQTKLTYAKLATVVPKAIGDVEPVQIGKSPLYIIVEKMYRIAGDEYWIAREALQGFDLRSEGMH